MLSLVAYWLFGYALSYGADNVFVGGANFWGFAGVPASQFSHFWANYVYAAVAVSIATSAWVERCHMVVYLVFTVFWAGIFSNYFSIWPI